MNFVDLFPLISCVDNPSATGEQMEPRSCFSAPRARPRPGLSGELRRQARGKEKQCKCAPQQIIFNALFLVAFNPSGLSGRLQPHSPGKGNDRHYYPARNTGAVRGGRGGRCCLASSKIWEPNFQREIEDTEKDQAMFQGPAGPPPPPPASLPDHPQIHVHWAGTRSVGVSSVPECLEK